MTRPRRLTLLATAAGGAAVVASAAGPEPATPALRPVAASVRVAGCADGGTATARVVRGRDAVLGPLVLIGASFAATAAPEAFDRHGYKLPVTLPAGTTATLAVPWWLRARVGLVFSLDTQDAVSARGVRAADRAVRFVACAGRGRTGWPGGLVTDKRRCATLVLTVPGRAPVRHRVPLGRRC